MIFVIKFFFKDIFKRVCWCHEFLHAYMYLLLHPVHTYPRENIGVSGRLQEVCKRCSSRGDCLIFLLFPYDPILRLDLHAVSQAEELYPVVITELPLCGIAIGHFLL